MTIWLLALLLLASLAGLGYRQGVIRVAFSLAGILFAAVLALPLGYLLRFGLGPAGVKHPLALWFIPPLIAFLIVLVIFKAAGFAVDRKVDVHFKYKAGDLRLALWERLNHRLGLCLGVANGAAYLVLISFVIYVFGYWTVQVAADSDPWHVRLFNRLASDLQSSGMSKAAGAIQKMPPDYYATADLAGLLYHHPPLQDRLASYPAFLSLAERPEFQDLGNDAEFSGMRLRQAPARELLNYPKAQAIWKNPDMLRTIWAVMQPDLKDLEAFLRTGQSEKYDSEKIVGRWGFDLHNSMLAFRRTKSNLAPGEIQRTRAFMLAAYGKATLVAAPDNQAFLKNVPQTVPGAVSTELQNRQGDWKKSGEQYELSFGSGGQTESMTGVIDGGRLTLSGSGPALVFTRED